MKPRRSGIPVKAASSSSPRGRPQTGGSVVGTSSHHQPRSLFSSSTPAELSADGDSVRKYATEETPLNLSSTNLSVLTCGEDESERGVKPSHHDSSSSDDDQALLDQCVRIAWAEKSPKKVSSETFAGVRSVVKMFRDVENLWTLTKYLA